MKKCVRYASRLPHQKRILSERHAPLLWPLHENLKMNYVFNICVVEFCFFDGVCAD